MRRLAILVAALPLLVAAVAVSTGGSAAAPARDGSFEVWALDQSNTTGTASGGTLHVYAGSSLEGRPENAVSERIDLGGATAARCVARTGSAPVRPHMVFFDAGHSHAVVAFVASGHVVLLDADSRTPLDCVDAGAQAHAAVPSPDGRFVVVANQNGKLLQRIAVDYGAGALALDPAATIDLAGCTTPSGVPCQSAALRPDNAPICPIVDSSSRFAFVTLRGGGLFVVDIGSTPMRIVAEYDRATIHGNGCGGVETGGSMYVNSGGGTAANLSEFDVYAFRLADFSTAAAPPNTPAPRLVVSQDDRELTDSHGAVATKHGRYLWVADRAGNRIVVVDTETDAVAGEIALPGDPSPDLLGLAPAGNRVFATFRGSLPLSGDPHVSTGSTPGVGVIRVEAGGRTGTLQGIAPIANLDGLVDRADPHGLAVRRLP